jgi:hypothetical protein
MNLFKPSISDSEGRKESSSRIATLDFSRGLAIFLMTFFHSFYHVFDYNWFFDDSKKLFEYPIYFLIPIIILLYLGTWNSLFLFVSCTVNTFGMVRGIRKGVNPEQLLVKKLITGVFLLIADYVIEAILYHGYLGASIRTGNWSDTSRLWEYFFRIKTLQIIGWSIIITSLITYFLIRKEGYKRFKRNMIVFGSLALIFLILTQLVYNWADNMPWYIPEGLPSWPYIPVQEANASFKAWYMTLLTGDMEPIFPYLITAFVGSMLGLALAQPKPHKHLPRWFALSGFVSVMIGTVLAIFWIPFKFFGRPSLSTFFIQIGLQILIIMMILRLVEYRGKGENFANNWLVKIFRRWGMIALSIYALEIFDLIPEWFLNITIGNWLNLNFFHRIFGYGQISYALYVAIFALLWYEGLVRIWAYFNFKGSFEWFLIKVQTFGSKQTSRRLDSKRVLNETEWMNFNEDIKSDSVAKKLTNPGDSVDN